MSDVRRSEDTKGDGRGEVLSIVNIYTYEDTHDVEFLDLVYLKLPLLALYAHLTVMAFPNSSLCMIFPITTTKAPSTLQ